MGAQFHNKPGHRLLHDAGFALAILVLWLTAKLQLNEHNKQP